MTGKMRPTPEIESLSVPLVIGSGIAGLTTALSLQGSVVVTKGAFESGSSDLAQGGIAAAIGAGDSALAHAADTVAVGNGLVDETVAALATAQSPARIRWLQDLGARFDTEEPTHLDLGREAGHSENRIVHANGDATGREVMRALRAAVRNRPDITVLTYTSLIDLARTDEYVIGAVVTTDGGPTRVLLAPAVILATGGIGRAYAKTTNPAEVTGDGLAVAARAGALLRDVEFVQFHPTALDAGADPLPLLTEALRGAGATLVDGDGRAFMAGVHPLGDLAPRDVVSRSVWRESKRDGAFLDATPLGASLPHQFPTAFATAEAAGLDARVELLPVTPAAHYHMGGVVTDSNGRTSLAGLYACGEVASTGLHGANRLASNSLLEGLVFGERVAATIGEGVTQPIRTTISVPLSTIEEGLQPSAEISSLRRAMWANAGVVRHESGLMAILRTIEALEPDLETSATGRNMAAVAKLVATRALGRAESRGSHYRSDFPETGRPQQRAFSLRPVRAQSLPVRTPVHSHVA